MESLTNPEESHFLLPVIHLSVTLRELRLYLGNHQGRAGFTETHFPELRALHCSASIFRFINAPKLEALHLLWSGSSELMDFSQVPSAEKVQIMLQSLTTLDIYSNYDPRLHPISHSGGAIFSVWMLYLHSLQILILGQGLGLIDDLIHYLWRGPTWCPKLTTIDSFSYPERWSSLQDCIEKQNHRAMQDRSIHSC